VAQLYHQAPGSFFVATYDSQGYGGIIRTRLHTGQFEVKVKFKVKITYGLRFTANHFVLASTP
jgi:hypothetical protein